MNEPSFLWPLPWWTAALSAAAIVAASWIAARIGLAPRNRRTQTLGEQLRDAGLSQAGAFSVPGDHNSLVVAGARLAVVDTRDARIVQTLGLDEVTALKIYEVAADTIPFRLIGRNGAQSRKVTTRSVVDFARLFGVMAGASKRIEYIEE
jgi:hypothetical protein